LSVGFRAVLLAGGRGNRMASLFPEMPKAIVPIGGTPLLALQLSRLSLSGCAHAVVVGGHGILQVRSALRALSPSCGAVLVEETSGTLPAVLTGLAALMPPLAPVVVLNADTIVDVDIAWCIAAAPSWAAVTAVLTELPTGQSERSVFSCAVWSCPCLRGDRLPRRQPRSRTFRVFGLAVVRGKLRESQ
jgi:NDP-sugar pyrophosphorylase family protein